MAQPFREAQHITEAPSPGRVGLSVQIMGPEASFTNCISGLVVEYIVAIDVTRVRFPADALWR